MCKLLRKSCRKCVPISKSDPSCLLIVASGHFVAFKKYWNREVVYIGEIWLVAGTCDLSVWEVWRSWFIWSVECESCVCTFVTRLLARNCGEAVSLLFCFSGGRQGCRPAPNLIHRRAGASPVIIVPTLWITGVWGALCKVKLAWFTNFSCSARGNFCLKACQTLSS